MIGETSIQQTSNGASISLAKLIKHFFKKQEAKKERHAHQSSTPSGVDYSQDLVIYLIGIDDALVEKVDLKERKVRISEE